MKDKLFHCNASYQRSLKKTDNLNSRISIKEIEFKLKKLN